MRTLLFFGLAASSFMYVEAEEPVCHKCQIIREYNRTHKETDFIYYEDYLKDKEEKAKQKPSGDQPADQKSE